MEVAKLPMFLSATTFEMETYGECCTHYKERLGLETESKQDLFVLRNVVSYFASPERYVLLCLGVKDVNDEPEPEKMCLPMILVYTL